VQHWILETLENRNLGIRFKFPLSSIIAGGWRSFVEHLEREHNKKEFIHNLLEFSMHSNLGHYAPNPPINCVWNFVFAMLPVLQHTINVPQYACIKNWHSKDLSLKCLKNAIISKSWKNQESFNIGPKKTSLQKRSLPQGSNQRHLLNLS